MMLLFFKKVRSRIYKISKSSTESKYCACHPHALWLFGFEGLLGEVSILHITPTLFYANNNNALQIASNMILHKCMEHIKVNYYSIYETLN
jgi:hypothetical protein